MCVRISAVSHAPNGSLNSLSAHQLHSLFGNAACTQGTYMAGHGSVRCMGSSQGRPRVEAKTCMGYVHGTSCMRGRCGPGPRASEPTIVLESQ